MMGESSSLGCYSDHVNPLLICMEALGTAGLWALCNLIVYVCTYVMCYVPASVPVCISLCVCTSCVHWVCAFCVYNCVSILLYGLLGICTVHVFPCSL